MISSVRGTVLAAAGTIAVIEVGGLGLSIQVTTTHALSLRVGSEATVLTTLIVREDDLSLYGFATSEQLAVFDFLRGVSGVGPKSAMGVLGVMSPAEIALAVAHEDDAAFRKVSGIGPKTAKLIIVSLSGKLGGVALTAAPAPVAASTVRQSVLDALIGLGWAERIAVQAVESAEASATEAEQQSVPTLLRLALTGLGPQLSGGKTPR